jgi:hypothetical protein
MGVKEKRMLVLVIDFYLFACFPCHDSSAVHVCLCPVDLTGTSTFDLG